MERLQPQVAARAGGGANSAVSVLKQTQRRCRTMYDGRFKMRTGKPLLDASSAHVARESLGGTRAADACPGWRRRRGGVSRGSIVRCRAVCCVPCCAAHHAPHRLRSPQPVQPVLQHDDEPDLRPWAPCCVPALPRPHRGRWLQAHARGRAPAQLRISSCGRRPGRPGGELQAPWYAHDLLLGLRAAYLATHAANPQPRHM